jgi:general secretion pathway protein C
MWSRLSRAGLTGAERGRWSELSAMGACALLAMLAIWLFARLLWMLVPGDDTSTSVPLRAAIATSAVPAISVSKWHLFGAAPQRLGAQRNAPATTLALSLRGTLADANPRTGIAVIADEQGVERAWRVGDEITPGVKLDEVHADRVVLLHDGAQEVLPLVRNEEPLRAVAPIPASARGGAALRNTAPDSAPPITFAPPQMAHGSMDWQQTMDRIGGSPGDLAKKVRIDPVIDNGRIAGVRVSAAGGDAALLAQLGLRPSDIVTAVNGLPVDSVARGQQILESLGNATSVRVTVTRDGVPAEINVKLR